MAPAELARKLVTEHLLAAPPDLPEDPTLTLFAQWDTDDEQMPPEEVTEAQRDYAEFTRLMKAFPMKKRINVICYIISPIYRESQEHNVVDTLSGGQ